MLFVHKRIIKKNVLKNLSSAKYVKSHSVKMEQLVDYLPIDFSGLTVQLKKQAEFELFENHEIVKHTLQELNALIKDDKGINFPVEDKDLLPFLRARKFNFEKAYFLFANHVSMIRKHDVLFKDISFLALKNALDSDSIGCLPRRDVDGCAIVVFFLDKWNPLEIPFVEIVRTGFLGILAILRYHSTQITGVKIIQDYKNLTLRKLTYMPPWVFKFSIDAMQNILPMRVKGLHIVNNGYLFYYVWSMMKPLLSKKLSERIHFHGSDFKSLHKVISPSILPEELGGSLGPHDNKEWTQFMKGSEEYIRTYIKRVKEDDHR